MSDKAVSSVAAPAAGAFTVVHTAGEAQLVNIRLANRDGANGITVDAAICPSTYVNGTPADAYYIEPKTLPIEGGGIVEDIGMLLAAGEKVVVRTSTATLSVRVYGYKLPAAVAVSTLAVLANGNWQTVHTVGAGKTQTLNVRATNLSVVSPISVSLAVCQPGYVNGAAPALAEYIEAAGLSIEAGGLIENYGFAAKAGEKVAAFTSAATLAVRVAATEE